MYENLGDKLNISVPNHSPCVLGRHETFSAITCMMWTLYMWRLLRRVRRPGALWQ